LEGKAHKGVGEFGGGGVIIEIEGADKIGKFGVIRVF
jgi:hypothetical protein